MIVVPENRLYTISPRQARFLPRIIRLYLTPVSLAILDIFFLVILIKDLEHKVIIILRFHGADTLVVLIYMLFSFYILIVR